LASSRSLAHVAAARGADDIDHERLRVVEVAAKFVHGGFTSSR
jgi:hypothetical protein